MLRSGKNVRKRPSRHQRFLGRIELDVLELLASLGDTTIAMLVSGRSTKMFHKTARERAERRYRMKLALKRLESRGLLQKRGEILSISESGRRSIAVSIGEVRKLLKEKTWDGRWRIVSFDIPERLRHLRYGVRSILTSAGFKRLHHSLWIFPHDCEELVALIKRESKLQPYIMYAVIERLDTDATVRNLFSVHT